MKHSVIIWKFGILIKLLTKLANVFEDDIKLSQDCKWFAQCFALNFCFSHFDHSC